MNRLLGRRAVLVGAGIEGLSVAGALAGHFEQVQILECDRLQASAGSRSGTPQDQHSHALLARCLEALNEISPGAEGTLSALALPFR